MSGSARLPRRRPRRFSLAMSTVIETLERAQLRRVPAFQAGDRVSVHFQVIEGTRRRTQVFEGVVIKRQGHGVRETFTVRKQSFGVGVERTFPRALAEDRADRGGRPRRRPPRQALLPARPRRQARPRPRAPLHRSRGGRRARAAARPRRPAGGRGGRAARARWTPTGETAEEVVERRRRRGTALPRRRPAEETPPRTPRLPRRRARRRRGRARRAATSPSGRRPSREESRSPPAARSSSWS